MHAVAWMPVLNGLGMINKPQTSFLEQQENPRRELLDSELVGKQPCPYNSKGWVVGYANQLF